MLKTFALLPKEVREVVLVAGVAAAKAGKEAIKQGWAHPEYSVAFLLALYFFAPHRLVVRAVIGFCRKSALGYYYGKYEQKCERVQEFFLGEEYVSAQRKKAKTAANGEKLPKLKLMYVTPAQE